MFFIFTSGDIVHCSNFEIFLVFQTYAEIDRCQRAHGRKETDGTDNFDLHAQLRRSCRSNVYTPGVNEVEISQLLSSWDPYIAIDNIISLDLLGEPPLATIRCNAMERFVTTFRPSDTNFIQSIDDTLIPFHIFDNLKKKDVSQPRRRSLTPRSSRSLMIVVQSSCGHLSSGSVLVSIICNKHRLHIGCKQRWNRRPRVFAIDSQQIMHSNSSLFLK